MILEKNILQRSAKREPNLTSSLQSHIYTQKIATIFDHIKSHNGQALDHRRLIRPGKKIRPNSLRSTSLLYKILPTNLGEWKPTFLPFIHHIWGETVLWGTLFIRQTSDRTQHFTICNINYTYSIFRTIGARGAFS